MSPMKSLDFRPSEAVPGAKFNAIRSNVLPITYIADMHNMLCCIMIDYSMQS